MFSTKGLREDAAPMENPGRVTEKAPEGKAEPAAKTENRTVVPATDEGSKAEIRVSDAELGGEEYLRNTDATPFQSNMGEEKETERFSGGLYVSRETTKAKFGCTELILGPGANKVDGVSMNVPVRESPRACNLLSKSGPAVAGFERVEETTA